MNQNSYDFWNILDKLCSEHRIVIDRPKGTHHPKYTNYVYPLDYGYIEGTASSDGAGIDVWLGSQEQRKVCGIISCIDYVKKDSEIKVLIACTNDEMQLILADTNLYDGRKGILNVR